MIVFFFFVSKLLISREQAADYLGISLRRLDRLASQGVLKPRRLGDSVRFELPHVIRLASRDRAKPDQHDTDAEGRNDHDA